jgi:hypothetical protein
MNKKNIIRIILIIVLIVLIGAVLFVFKNNGNGDENNVPENGENVIDWKTPSYVLAHEELMGGEVSVKGIAQASEDVVCQEESCVAPLVLKGEEGEIELGGVYEGKRVECLGDSSSLECYPLEKGKEYIVNGLWMDLELDIGSFQEYEK